MCRVSSIITLLVLSAAPLRAGLYYSGEQYASLPAQWRGFLLDHRALRNIGVNTKVDSEASPLRIHYRAEAIKLSAKKKFTPDELADLGALHIRLGEIDRAIEVLRSAQRANPNHFAIAANLGTAWQLQGDLRQAAAALEDAVRLAPGKYLVAEEAHLKLVRGRQQKPTGELDDLFGVPFTGAKNMFEIGKIAPDQMKRLPTKAASVVQRLALWLPSDGPLLWQLAELANAHGDVRNAAAMMEGCVVQFGMKSVNLRKRRQLLRDAVDNLPKAKVGDDHVEQHSGTLAFRSRRPLVSRFEAVDLGPIDAKGVNPVPWELFTETGLERPFKVVFPKYLRDLEGKQVALNGFMYPLRDEIEVAAFLFIEAPVGCWFCETPDATGIIFVEMSKGQSTSLRRGAIRVTGRLRLNASDAEDFLFALKDARVTGSD